jgi:hypothetical protein
MNTGEMINALERERQLLKDFRCLSQQQLELLEDEDPTAIVGLNKLLELRAELMLELQAIETTLDTWIDQIRSDSTVTAEVLRQLRILNDDVVELAKQVVEIDEQTHWRLDNIRSKTGNKLRGNEA